MYEDKYFTSYAGFTPSSRDYTLRPRVCSGAPFGKWHGTVHDGCPRCRTVSRNWPIYIHNVSILITQIKSRQYFSHHQKCRDISSVPTADRCEPAIMRWKHPVEKWNRTQLTRPWVWHVETIKVAKKIRDGIEFRLYELIFSTFATFWNK